MTTIVSKKTKKKIHNKQNNYLREFLKVSPLSLSIWRGIEAYQLNKHMGPGYKRPILDIGCGFGEFAGVFYNKSVEVGVDIDDKDLLRARQAKKFKKLIRADARNMPFPDNKFNTIISNSVLEHIPSVDKVFKESYRVLKPGGIFVYTVAIESFYKNLYFSSLFENHGFSYLGKMYYRAINQVFHHINVFPRSKWIRMTKKAGFTISLKKDIISKSATRVFDLTLLPSLPSQMSRWFFGKRFVYDFPGRAEIAEKLFGHLIYEEANPGSNLLVIAKKR